MFLDRCGMARRFVNGAPRQPKFYGGHAMNRKHVPDTSSTSSPGLLSGNFRAFVQHLSTEARLDIVQTET